MSHTPAPWIVVHELREHDEIIADCVNRTWVVPANGQKLGHWESDARLIAAAPDMLAALRRAALALAFAAEKSEAMQDDYNAVSAAIAQATGGAA